MNKGEKIGLAIGAGLLLLAAKSKAASQGGPAADAKLLGRANSKDASAWRGVVMFALNVSADVAAAVARWFGIESGGNPLAVSSNGERGLAQISKTSALIEGALTADEWAQLTDKNTSGDQQARLGWKVIDWCYSRAVKYIQDPPPATDPISRIWYAKLYHQRPVDVRDAELTGEATADAYRLEMEWSGDPVKLHYLHTANVVAWNSLLPPHPPSGAPLASK